MNSTAPTPTASIKSQSTGLCECGCGRPTGTVKWSDATRGIKKGAPRRFVRGHSSRSLSPTLPAGVLVDPLDIPLLAPYTWSIGGNGYARTQIYDANTQKSRILTLHRFIMLAKPGSEIDHINGNKLDNRRANLRFVTHSENMLNHHRLRARHATGSAS